MLIERQVKVQAHLETLLNEYSSSCPFAKQLQAELDALKVEMKKMSEIDEAMIPKPPQVWDRCSSAKRY